MADLQVYPPHNPTMERCVLGCTLHGEQALSDVLAIVPDPGCFYEPIHQLIYECVLELNRSNKPVDAMTLANALDEKGALQKIGGLGTLLAMREEVPLVSRAEVYAREVYNKAMLRRLIRVCDELKASCSEPNSVAENVIAVGTKKFYDLGQSGQIGSLEEISAIMRRTVNEMYEMAKDGDPYKKRLLTGYRNLDRTLGGLSRGSLNILAARPGVGKSAFALNVAQNAAFLYGKSIAIFSLEMSKDEIAQRFIASKGQLDAKLFRNFAQMSAEERNRLSGTLAAFYDKQIYVDDLAGTSPVEILARCRQKKIEGKLDLIIIDYLQLMTMKERNFSRQQEVSEISRFLKLMAKELDVPVLALSQLNRESAKRPDEGEEPRVPQLSDLRESGSIEQDADTVIFLYRKKSDEENSRQNEDEPLKVAVRVAKNRGGPIRTFDFLFYGKNYWFSEPANRNEPGFDAPPEEALLSMEASGVADYVSAPMQASEDLSYLDQMQPSAPAEPLAVTDGGEEFPFDP